MLKKTLCVLLMTLLTGCATAGSCSFIPLAEYDKQFTLAFSDEILNLSAHPHVRQYIVDADNLRAKVRACKG